MSRLITRVKSFRDGEDAASMVEYGLLVGLIAIACVGALSLLGQGILLRFFVDVAGTFLFGRPVR
jgi:Flp pilus assembly pilin Flp